MKKLFYLTAFVCTVLFFSSCAKDNANENAKTRKINFNINGDFVFNDLDENTKNSIMIDGKAMTDLWVVDYTNGELGQILHQTQSDSNFGNPTMEMRYGSHNLYFIVSRGTGPSINIANNTISWTKPSDTFWKNYQMTVSDDSSSTHSITLERVVTRLRVIVLDTLQPGAVTASVRPSTWYYGFNFQTGAPAFMSSSVTNTINIPSDRIGTDSNSFMMYGFSTTTEWYTNVYFAINNSTEPVVARTFENVEFRRNRSTDYIGYLSNFETGFSLNFIGWDTSNVVPF